MRFRGLYVCAFSEYVKWSVVCVCVPAYGDVEECVVIVFGVAVGQLDDAWRVHSNSFHRQQPSSCATNIDGSLAMAGAFDIVALSLCRAAGIDKNTRTLVR